MIMYFLPIIWGVHIYNTIPCKHYHTFFAHLQSFPLIYIKHFMTSFCFGQKSYELLFFFKSYLSLQVMIT